MPVQPARPRISTTRADAAPEHRREREDQQDARDRGEDVVDPLEEVADLAAEEAGEGAEHGADQRWPPAPPSTPTKTEICGALDRLGEHVAAEPVAAEGQGLGARRLAGLVLLGRARPIPCSAARAGRPPRCRRSARSAPAIALDSPRPRPGPTKVGGAFGTPTSTCQSLATRPSRGEHDQQQEQRRRSPARPCRRGRLRKRRQAACQTPSERCARPCAGRPWSAAGSRQDDGAHLSTTRGSTSL